MFIRHNNSLKRELLLIILFIIIALLFPHYISAEEEIVFNWYFSEDIQYPVASHDSLILNNKLYITGGSVNYAYDFISYSQINSNGSLSSWSFPSQLLPIGLFYHSMTKTNAHAYILGGINYPPATPSNKVYYSEIDNPSTSLETWTETLSLPESLYLGKSIIINDNIYYLGGAYLDDGNEYYTNKIYFSSINADGSLASWVQTTSLPERISRFGIIYTQNKLYIIGGWSHNAKYSNKVYYSTVNSNGTLNPWIETYQLPAGLNRAGIVKSGNFIIVAGGNMLDKITDLNTNSNKVYYSKINSDGSINNWVESSHVLPIRLCCGTLEENNNNLYLVGGYSVDHGGFLNKTIHSNVLIQDGLLSVPDIKQYNNSWASNIYDNAINWSSIPTIERWGCALTSATMTLQYYNYEINPFELNNWLINNHGYTRNGNLRWPALSTFTSQFNNEIRPLLEYSNLPYNSDYLRSELESERPVIVRLPDPLHFVVSKGINNQDFFINDPGQENYSLLSQSVQTHSQPDGLRVFVPTHTNLSYLNIYVDNNIDVILYDSENNIVSGLEYLNLPPYDNITREISNNPILNAYDYSKLNSGKYKVHLRGDGEYTLDFYIQDINGSVMHHQATNNLNNNKAMYLLNFDNEDINNFNIVEVDYDSIISYLMDGYKNEFIKYRVLYNYFYRMLKYSKKLYSHNRINFSIYLLNNIQKYLTLFTPKYIDLSFSEELQYRITLLISIL